MSTKIRWSDELKDVAQQLYEVYSARSYLALGFKNFGDWAGSVGIERRKARFYVEEYRRDFVKEGE